jgi:hypothetical protein
MRIDARMEKGRIRTGYYGSDTGDDFGAFSVVGPRGELLKIIVSPGDADPDIPWEHVSVSLKNRCPTWAEMCWVKDMFWEPEETVVQFHPPRSRWVNNHSFCLHLWRPINQEIPLPPEVAVGYKELNIK